MKAKSEGFTLIEMALVIIISGLLLAAGLESYKVYNNDQARKTTLENIQTVNSAIALFHAVYDRYPCPADITLPLGDPDYGRETNCDPRPVNPVAGTCFEGVCRADGRDADNDATTEDTILIGGVPLVTLQDADLVLTGIQNVWLGLSSREILDGYGRKLTYAVTERLVTEPTFNETLGAIKIEDEYGESLVNPEGSVHYVVVSHGDNGRGAYSEGGQLVGNDCTASGLPLPLPAPPGPPVSSGNTIEYENCNNDDLFVSALRATVEGNSYNDDIVNFQMFVGNDLWSYVPGNPDVPGSIYNLNPGNVGIGVIDPDSKLEVIGDIQADEVLAGEICDSTGNDCFPSSIIGGTGNPVQDTDPLTEELIGKKGMECDGANKAMTGIANGRPICESVLPDTIIGTCPPGKFMIGVSSLGNVVCEE